jgi:GntR family transcriptional repressor for pyruvate dehydrogenase complex
MTAGEGALRMVLPAPEARRGKLSDVVLKALVDLLIQSGLKPGDALPTEGELCRSFGVSKPVVREALHRLVMMGVIEVRHGKPAVIRAMSSEPLELFFRFALRASRQGLREAVELRRALETQIAALAAARISAPQCAVLEGALADMRRAKEQPDQWVEADVRFHLGLAEAAGNGLILFLIEALRGTMEETIRVLNAQRPLRDPEATVRRHEAILDAVVRNDAAAARAAMEAHFDATEPVVLAILARPAG